MLINGLLNPAPVTLRVGVSHRLRLINITTFRPGLRVVLRRDTSLVTWRLLARDGAELPEQQRTVRPARLPLTIGETMDVEVTPRTPGDLRLDATAAVGQPLGSLVMRVVP